MQVRPTLAPPNSGWTKIAQRPFGAPRKKHADAAMAAVPFDQVAILPLDKVAAMLPLDKVAVLPLDPVKTGLARAREPCYRKAWPLCAPNN